MNNPYYIPKYYFNKANTNFNKFNFNNTLHQSPYQTKKIVPKEEMIDLTELNDSDEDNINNISVIKIMIFKINQQMKESKIYIMKRKMKVAVVNHLKATIISIMKWANS